MRQSKQKKRHNRSNGRRKLQWGGGDGGNSSGSDSDSFSDADSDEQTGTLGARESVSRDLVPETEAEAETRRLIDPALRQRVRRRLAKLVKHDPRYMTSLRLVRTAAASNLLTPVRARINPLLCLFVSTCHALPHNRRSRHSMEAVASAKPI